MSLALISHSSDLRRLRDEGYEVDVSNGYLIVRHVPYVRVDRQVAYGTLISQLDLAGESTVKPTNHVALWAGDYPSDSKGSPMTNLVNNPNMQEKIRDELVATYSFSQKPRPEGYIDYYEKMTAYIRILEGEARVLNASATAQTFPVLKTTDEESVFRYLDTSSSRAGIVEINEKLKMNRIAIVGLGGTGSYVLDLVAKTSVKEIHLFDGDDFLQHNAFRSPGSPSFEDLAKKPTKVMWYSENYSRMRRNVVPHPSFVDETNVSELAQMDFVFLCIDKGAPKRIIADFLIRNNVPFTDVGMGLYIENEAIGGQARITTFTPTFHDHLARRVPLSDGEGNEYSRNIQIAEMNALNAALAVIKWKKICGFYIDLENEHNTVYGLSTNLVTNDEIPSETKIDQA